MDADWFDGICVNVYWFDVSCVWMCIGLMCYMCIHSSTFNLHRSLFVCVCVCYCCSQVIVYICQKFWRT